MIDGGARAARIRVTAGTETPPPPPGVAGAGEAIPGEFALAQNYPNPFNPVTRIRFDLPVESRATLKVYDLLGRNVATVVEGIQPAGHRSVEWNGAGFASGLYIYRLDAASTGRDARRFTKARKLLLMR